MAESGRHGLVQRDARLLGQDEIKETNLTESGDKISCSFKIFQVWRNDQE
jgi:hypothetical protein